MHSPQELITQVGALPSLPSVHARIRKTVEAVDSTPADIADIISADPALTARLLQRANGPDCGRPARVDSVARALDMLGAHQVHELVRAMSLATTFDGIQPHFMDMQRFWRCSLMRGIAARNIARQDPRHDAERLFVTGLMSDLGHLAMYQVVPDLAEAVLRTAAATGESLQPLEHRLVGCDHAEVGVALMTHWRLPACFTDAVGAQHYPQVAGEFSYEAAVIRLAAHIVAAGQDALDTETALQRIEPGLWQRFELTPGRFAGLREALDNDLAAHLQALFPDAADI